MSGRTIESRVLYKALRAVVRTLLWPVRRFFDPRFIGVIDVVDAKHQDLGGQLAETLRLLHAELDTSAETASVIGHSLMELRDLSEQTYDVTSGRYLSRLASGGVQDIDEAVARVLNYSVSHEGFAAQKHVWFNPPLLIQYAPNDVRLASVSERIAEAPYVFRALAGVQPGARVLDVGAAESTVCLSLAALGYAVTALDPRPNPLSHPNLSVVAGTIEELEATTPFDAVVCLSTIEHIGVGAYGQEGGNDDADFDAMRHIWGVTRPGGVLVLTIPYGREGTNGFERTYDRSRLNALLDGWTLDDFTLIERADPLTWTPTENDEAEEASEQVALVTARRAT